MARSGRICLLVAELRPKISQNIHINIRKCTYCVSILHQLDWFWRADFHRFSRCSCRHQNYKMATWWRHWLVLGGVSLEARYHGSPVIQILPAIPISRRHFSILCTWYSYNLASKFTQDFDGSLKPIEKMNKIELNFKKKFHKSRDKV